MSRNYKFRDQTKPYFISFATVYWIDVFIRPIYKDIYQLWQQHNQPIELLNNEMMNQRLEYMHNNPVEARIVDKPEQYLYSSAIDYTGGTGYVSVTKLD